MARYRLTPARRRALRKAQLASARARAKTGARKHRRAIVAVGASAAIAGTVVGGRHVFNKNFIYQKTRLTDQRDRGRIFIDARRNKRKKTARLELGTRYNARGDLDFEHKLLSLGFVMNRPGPRDHIYTTRTVIYDPLYAGSRKRTRTGQIKGRKRRPKRRR